MRALVAAIGLACACGVAFADTSRETTLLQDDLAKNQRTRIDAPKDAFDADLDAALGGPQGFSTKPLEQIEDRIRAELRRDRPRASPRVILFLYPGRVDATLSLNLRRWRRARAPRLRAIARSAASSSRSSGPSRAAPKTSTSKRRR
jgi:hypothetical protein